MCNKSCIEFGKNLSLTHIQGKRILEVGSYDMNGSVADYAKQHHPSGYIGVDIVEGKGVDRILDVHALMSEFGPESFDIVISTEMIEHVEDWRNAIENMKGVLKRDGYILITTRSWGFPLHKCPIDCWRYEIDDMMKIFSDFEIIKCEPDVTEPGVFIFAKKPINYTPNTLKDIKLFDVRIYCNLKML